MKKSYAKTLAFVLALVMAVSGITWSGISEKTVAAATYEDSSTADGPEEATTNAQVYFVNVANGALVTVNGTENDPIDVSTRYTNANSVPTNGWFTVYYGEYDGKEVVNFTSSTSTSWKAEGDKVFQIARRTNPGGWESVQIVPNGDGTISFASSQNDNALTIVDQRLAVSNISKDDKGSLSNNEKFYMFTQTAPKKAREIKLSNVSGNSVDVSWTGCSQHLYSAYQVYYATSEKGPYTLAGATGDTTFMVDELNVNTRYFFKVRTITNLRQGNYSAYSDSAVVYTNTLKNADPSKVSIRSVTEGDDGSQTITWRQGRNTQYYQILRAESRYGEYKVIGTTTTLSYTDTDTNKDSKYRNYYKVQGVNGESYGALSEPGSLEISMFGANTYVFNEDDNVDEVNAAIHQIYLEQHPSQFGSGRYQYFFKPDIDGDGVGDYNDLAPIKVGYYTATSGLGLLPYDVELNNVMYPAALSDFNATCNFWTSIENLTISDETVNGSSNTGLYDFLENTFMWSASQAAPARRLVVEREAMFDWNYGWASGGYFADTVFKQKTGSYSQQQYYYRNCQFNPDVEDSIYGVNWNQVIQGCTGVDMVNNKDNSNNLFNKGKALLARQGFSNWASRGCTTVLDKTDSTREKPFLFFDSEADEYKVFVPSVRKDSTGVSYTEDSAGPGKILTLNSFYIAHPDDTAEVLNEKLGCGYNLILSPGTYTLEEPLEVTHEDTIIMGLGMATLTAEDSNDDTFIRVAGKVYDESAEVIGQKDIGGVEICNIILDAGRKTNSLIEMGYEGTNVNHSNNPSVLQDVICRVGGTGTLGTTGSCMVINSNDVIVDQTWIWRADHGDNTGWYENTAKNGLVVNGDRVTAYGLFVEHFQEYDILWRGEYGATYFLQNEKCYDPQDQGEWMSHGGHKNGYAAYKVTENVKNHYAVGLGVYDVFINTNGASIFLDNAIEVPNEPNVWIENACIVEIANGHGPRVGINNIVNDTCPGITTGEGTSSDGSETTSGGYAIQRLLSYNNKNAISLPDNYANNDEFGPDGLITNTGSETGETPSRDQNAEKDIQKEKETMDNSIPLDDMDDAKFQQKIKDATDEWNWAHQNHPKPETPKNPRPQMTNEDEILRQNGVQVGAVFTEGNYNYMVTSVSATTMKGTAQCLGFKSATLKNTATAITIAATATHNSFIFNITSVKGSAFKSSKKVKKVTIGKYVTTIGSSAFAKLKKLTTVKIGAKVTTIGNSAFSGCPKLKKITFGKAVKKINKNAFKGAKKVKTIKLGAKVTTIGASAFANCTSLKTITFGKKVKKINKKAFAKDKKIKTITFKGKALKKFKKNAFDKSVKKAKLKGNKKSIKVFKKSLKIK